MSPAKRRTRSTTAGKRHSLRQGSSSGRRRSRQASSQAGTRPAVEVPARITNTHTAAPDTPQRVARKSPGTKGRAKRRQPRPAADRARGSASARPAGRDRPPRAEDRALRSRPIRLRISQADPWSVMATSFVVLLGLGMCVILTVAALWTTYTLIDPEWPPMGWGFGIAALVVMLEAVLGTAMLTLAAFLYTRSSERTGGVELILDENVATWDLPMPDLPRSVDRLVRIVRARLTSQGDRLVRLTRSAHSARCRTWGPVSMESPPACDRGPSGPSNEGDTGMSRGKIQEWDSNQDEGKIKSDQGGPQLKFSSADLRNPAERASLHRGDKVEFEVAEPGHAVDVEKA